MKLFAWMKQKLQGLGSLLLVRLRDRLVGVLTKRFSKNLYGFWGQLLLALNAKWSAGVQAALLKQAQMPACERVGNTILYEREQAAIANHYLLLRSGIDCDREGNTIILRSGPEVV